MYEFIQAKEIPQCSKLDRNEAALTILCFQFDLFLYPYVYNLVKKVQFKYFNRRTAKSASIKK
jgi:hypothetical protein